MSLSDVLPLSLIATSVCSLLAGVLSFLDIISSKRRALELVRTSVAHLETETTPRFDLPRRGLADQHQHASGNMDPQELDELAAVCIENLWTARIALERSIFARFKPETRKALSSADESLRVLQDQISKHIEGPAGGDADGS